MTITSTNDLMDKSYSRTNAKSLDYNRFNSSLSNKKVISNNMKIVKNNNDINTNNINNKNDLRI